MSPKQSKNPFQTPAPIQFYEEEMEMDSGFVKYNEDQDEDNLRIVQHQRSHSAQAIPEIRVSAQPSIDHHKTFE